MTPHELTALLDGVRAGTVPVEEAVAKLRDPAVGDLGFATLDLHRKERCGFPEVILAEGKAPAETGLLTAPAKSGVAFRFPARAAEALANLDPRERFAVEYLFQGDRVVTATYEVGDFAAGRAFLAGGR